MIYSVYLPQIFIVKVKISYKYEFEYNLFIIHRQLINIYKKYTEYLINIIDHYL